MVGWSRIGTPSRTSFVNAPIVNSSNQATLRSQQFSTYLRVIQSSIQSLATGQQTETEVLAGDVICQYSPCTKQIMLHHVIVQRLNILNQSISHKLFYDATLVLGRIVAQSWGHVWKNCCPKLIFEFALVDARVIWRIWLLIVDYIDGLEVWTC